MLRWRLSQSLINLNNAPRLRQKADARHSTDETRRPDFNAERMLTEADGLSFVALLLGSLLASAHV